MENAAAEAAHGDAYDVAMSLARESGIYLFYKADTSVEGQSRFANVEELLNSVKAYMEEVEADAIDEKPQVTLADYLENVSLLANVDVAEDETSNKVALMTVHTAKGLEFPYVFVAGMEENLFPSGGWMETPQELEEERRLFYVALTRAKRAVSLSYAETRMRNGKHESNAPSRFLRELAPQYLDKPLLKEDLHRGGEDNSDFGGFRWGRTRVGREMPVYEKGKDDLPATISHPVAGGEKPPLIDPNFVPDPMSSFRVGDQIEHNRFGAGKVLEISGRVPDLKAKILFEKYGEKLLLLKFAKIRHK
jgi:DNA helicase-2/ATP-dependent DNA helicase PcrA